jgi:REP element-mobilizing transposase RayT
LNNKDIIEKQLWGIASNIKCTPISIYCNPDHLHFLVGMKPVICVADAIRDLKSFSSRFINENRLMRRRFEWQTGYGAFTYGQSQIKQLKTYIENQGEHHRKYRFKDEYIAFLEAFEIDYDETYLFDWIL